MLERTIGEARLARGKGEHGFLSLGSDVRVLATGEQTGGRFAVFETCERPGTEPPRHVHTREDEVIYVVDGRVTLYREADRLDCPSGTCVYLPRGCEHSLRVESAEARLLIMVAPSGLEGAVQELSRQAALQDEPAEVDEQLEVERLVTVAARYGLEITGPP